MSAPFNTVTHSLTPEQRKMVRDILVRYRGKWVMGSGAPNKASEGWTLSLTPSIGTPHTVILRLYHQGLRVVEYDCSAGAPRLTYYNQLQVIPSGPGWFNLAEIAE